MSVPVGWSPWAKSFAVTLSEGELVELATGHMERVARLQEEDGVKLTFQVIIQGEAAEDTARKVMGLLYPANNILFCCSIYTTLAVAAERWEKSNRLEKS